MVEICAEDSCVLLFNPTHDYLSPNGSLGWGSQTAGAVNDLLLDALTWNAPIVVLTSINRTSDPCVNDTEEKRAISLPALEAMNSANASAFRKHHGITTVLYKTGRLMVQNRDRFGLLNRIAHRTVLMCGWVEHSEAAQLIAKQLSNHCRRLHVSAQTLTIGRSDADVKTLSPEWHVLPSTSSFFPARHAAQQPVATDPIEPHEAERPIDRAPIVYGTLLHTEMPAHSEEKTSQSWELASPGSRQLRPLRVLYWANGSIPSWRTMMALYEKNLNFSARRLKVMSKPKETRLPEFLNLNHRGKTPTLIDVDGTLVNESLAILMYLELSYSTGSLLLPPPPPPHPSSSASPSNGTSSSSAQHPGTSVRFARVLARMEEAQNLQKAYGPMEVFFDLRSASSTAIQAGLAARDKIEHELGYWEVYASQAEFIAGEEFSLADCAFYPVLAYIMHRGLMLDRNKFPNLRKYVERVGSRRSAQMALPVGYDLKTGKNLFTIARAYEKEQAKKEKQEKKDEKGQENKAQQQQQQQHDPGQQPRKKPTREQQAPRGQPSQEQSTKNQSSIDDWVTGRVLAALGLAGILTVILARKR